MAGVNTGGEDIYEVNGRPSHRTHYEHVDGRGKTLTLPEMPQPVEKITDGGNCSYTFALAAAPGAVFELPVPGDEYIIIANGATAYCRMGGAGTVATIAVGGHDFPVGDGIHFRCRPGFTHIAYVAAAPAGNITFLHLREP
jgi:hypothetical protein